jgi:hypothetical protein
LLSRHANDSHPANETIGYHEPGISLFVRDYFPGEHRRLADWRAVLTRNVSVLTSLGLWLRESGAVLLRLRQWL